MSTITRKAFIIIISTVLFFSLSCVSSIVSIFIGIDRIKAGVSEKSIQVDDHTIVYLEGGEGETVVLLHGFGANKENWLRFAKYLTDKYHVIAPDLPGFGESSQYMNVSYDMATQAERLKRFVQVKKLGKFHLAGNSMGGYIAGTYALKYPDDLLSLGLFAAAGVKSPQKSEYQKLKEKGEHILVVKDAAGYDEMMNFVFVKPIELPGPVKQFLAEQAVARREMNEKIYREIGNVTLLHDKLHLIKTPTLVLWGDTDRVFHVSAAGVFHRGIKNSEMVIMKECGHLPMLERPEEAAGHYLKFIRAF